MHLSARLRTLAAYTRGNYMPKSDLTDRFVAAVRAKSKTEYFDARTTGLGLRVSPSGVKGGP